MSLMKRMAKLIEQDMRMKKTSSSEVDGNTIIYSVFDKGGRSSESGVYVIGGTRFFANKKDAEFFCEQENINQDNIKENTLDEYVKYGEEDFRSYDTETIYETVYGELIEAFDAYKNSIE